MPGVVSSLSANSVPVLETVTRAMNIKLYDCLSYRYTFNLHHVLAFGNPYFKPYRRFLNGHKPDCQLGVSGPPCCFADDDFRFCDSTNPRSISIFLKFHALQNTCLIIVLRTLECKIVLE